MAPLAVLLAVLALAAGVQAVDPCAAIAPALSAGRAVPGAKAFACYKHFPYDKSIASRITDTLIKTFQLHTYKDISKKSPTPQFPLKVNVIRKIQRVAAFKYPNDFGLNAALYKAVNTLNDGHAVYLPICYRVTRHYHAFPAVKVASGKTEVIKVSPLAGTVNLPVVAATEKQLLGLKVSDYAGALIKTIDGVDALSFILKYAQSAGVYKDISGRVNSVLSHTILDGTFVNGLFSQQRPYNSPLKSYYNLTVVRKGSTKTETLQVPIYAVLADISNNFTTSANYYKKYCFQAVPSVAVRKAQKPISVGPLKGVLGDREERINVPSHLMQFNVLRPASAGAPLPEAVSSRKPSVYLLYQNYINTYMLTDMKTGVMTFPDMEGPSGDYVTWNFDVAAGIAALQKYKAKRLIIDMADNPGGYAVLGYALLEYLFPAVGALGAPYPIYPIQNPATPFAQRMVKIVDALQTNTSVAFQSSSQYGWALQADVNGSLFTSADGYFFPTRFETYGGIKERYSNLYKFLDRLGPPFGINYIVPSAADYTPKFPADQVIILSNGDCYSTCSIFSYGAQEYAGVRIASVGGILGKPMAYSAGSAGYSYVLSSLLDGDIAFTGLEYDKDAPQPLPVQAIVGYTGAQAFCLQSNVTPADFVFKASDIRFPYTDKTVANPVHLWEETATYFH